MLPENLHSFAGKVGDIVDRTIDKPFYEDMDAFVAAMRDLSISNYTTTNRIGATEIVHSYAGYGVPQQFEIDKAEVSVDDLFSGDSFYSEQMKLEYEEWKKLNPDQDFSQEEYQQAIVNTRAFEYESIRNTQENKEFWFQIGALVVIVGASLIFPPAGIALGVAYGAYELTSAVSGKDLVSRRELDTSERWVRGALAPLDIIPGAGVAVTKFAGAGATGLVRIGGKVVPTGLKTGVNAGIQKGVTSVKNLAETATNFGAVRLKSAGTVIQNRTNVMINKVKEGTIEGAKLADKAITGAKNLDPRRIKVMETTLGNKVIVHDPAENTHTFANKISDIINRNEGVNINKDLENLRSENNLVNPINGDQVISRIQYLHNKYGKFTLEELNNRINLRGAVAHEVERLNKLGLSKREIGPAVAGTFDKTTGKYYFGINNPKGKIPEELHPEIYNRIKNMPNDIKDGYNYTYGAGSHAEVYSLNQALLANPNAKPSDLITHVVRSGKN